MSQPVPIDAGLRREISRLGFGAMALNGVIGAGIFALPAVAAEAAGLFSPWLFLVCGVLIMTVVLSFARAASFFSNTGGPLAYVGHAFGPFAGFQVGWLFTFSRVAAMAANTNLLVTYSAWFWEPLATGLFRQAAITAVIAFLVYVNVIGVKRGVLAMFAFTLLKLIPLSLLVLLGLSQLNPAVFLHPGAPELDGIGGTLLVLMYAFVGFEGAVVPAGEARDPRRDIPRALALSAVIVAVLYVLIQIVSISVQPEIGASSRPLIDVMALLMGPAGAALMAAGAVFSITGNVSSMMLSGPRMVYAMGRSEVLPAWFGRVHPLWATPSNAIYFIGVLGLALALSGSFIWLAAMSTVVRLIVYAACILSLPRLESRADAGDVPFALPGGYAIPLAGLLTSCWLITHAAARSWLVTGVFMAVGTVFYVLTRRGVARRTA
jgi:amino acid transporter